MKYLLVLSIPLLCISFCSTAQDDLMTGAWETSFESDSGKVDGLIIVSDGYLSTTYYNEAEKKFFWTAGGAWESDENELILVYEFHTDKPSKVGKMETFDFFLENDMLMVDGNSWQRVDDGTEYDLAGAWLITGRKRDGEISRRTPGARKTMKILSGTKFQWIAYNTESGEFFGTGGGSYTTKDGRYVENIEFFSRDGSRVGASLDFDYKLEGGEWHHSGLSSKGDPIYEIWTPRSMLEE